MILTVDVSHHDIASGKAQSCHACPVARAINRAMARLNLPSSATVGSAIRIWDRPEISTPPEVVAWYTAFDKGFKPGPFRFTLEIPEQGARHAAS